MTRTKCAVSVVVALTCLLTAVPARAHPMGNFSVSHHTTLRAEDGRLRLRLRIDMAEIATVQEMASLDVNGDQTINDGERQAYLDRVTPEITTFQTLKINGQAISLAAARSELKVRPGAADLPTLLLTIEYAVPLYQQGQTRYVVEYVDGAFEERTGWREIVAQAGDGFRVAESSVRDESRSDELERYPTDLTYVPPQIRDARVVYEATTAPTTGPAVASTTPPPPPQAAGNASTPRDRFTQLITAKEWSLGIMLLSLGVAFTLGSFHALSPGHGKTVVAAYLVGSRGTARHAMFLGAVVTLTHVSAVFLLGVIVLFAQKYVVPARIYPWLGFASGVMIVAIGLWQFVQRYAAIQMKTHTHGDGTAHSHAGGWFAHDHSHGPGGTHTHELPDRITPGALLALGVSGGIVPCPSALVVLLSAIYLQRVALGLALIVAFSMGLAFVLIAIGMLMLYARRLMDRFDWDGERSLLRRLPVISSAVIALLGLVIAIQSLVQGGILQIRLGGGVGPTPSAAIAGR